MQRGPVAVRPATAADCDPMHAWRNHPAVRAVSRSATEIDLAEHRRWSTRPGVRRALVFNPHTPVHVALRLVVTLSPADWSEIAEAHGLADPVRASARELHARRRQVR